MKRLLEIEEDHDFSLIGICTHAKDYRLCWELNRLLDIDLEKSAVSELDSLQGYNFSSYVDEENHRDCILISNKQGGRQILTEHPKIDYFLKLSGQGHIELSTQWKKQIQELDIVLTAIEIQPLTLKSAQNFAF